MKNYNVEISPEALNDIVDIVNFIYKKSRNKEVSLQIYDLLISKCNSLELFPEIYQILFDNIRRLVVNPYSIFYEIIWDKVIIYRVLWNAEDYFNISFK